MGSAVAAPCVWDDLVGQERAVRFLRAAAAEHATSHAYLFLGSAGVGKKTAAKAFACAIVCDDEGCGGCRECTRIRKGAHPDVQVVEPEGAATYVVEQVRDVIGDMSLKPLEASRKVYIFDRADAFNAEAANALLKNLEEPPEAVVIILLAVSHDAVLPTIYSRCQVVRFDRIPHRLSVAMLVERAGVSEDRAEEALAAAGGVLPRAIDLLGSRSRLAARDEILATLKNLSVMDGMDVLEAAKSLLSAVRAPLDELKSTQEAELRERRELLGKAGGSTKALEDRHKRELTARERDGLFEIMSVTESWLRDCLVISQGVGELAGNRDQVDAMEEVAAVLAPESAVGAIRTVAKARRRISYNVTPQLALEAMLFDIREVLRCPR
jgi:DNA polymerase-3 subunit delta'